MTWPVMYDEESDARKYTHSAISSAFPSLPSAMVSAIPNSIVPKCLIFKTNSMHGSDD